jgi:hypothetical protein
VQRLDISGAAADKGKRSSVGSRARDRRRISGQPQLDYPGTVMAGFDPHLVDPTYIRVLHGPHQGEEPAARFGELSAQPGPRGKKRGAASCLDMESPDWRRIVELANDIETCHRTGVAIEPVAVRQLVAAFSHVTRGS